MSTDQLLTENSQSCKICNGKARIVCHTDDRMIAEPLQHILCENCGTVFVGNNLTNEQLAAAYSAINWQLYYEQTKNEVQKKMAAALIDIKNLGIKRDDPVLDLGTGNGLFPSMLFSAGYLDVACHEIPGAEIPEIINKGVKEFRDFDYSTIPSSEFVAISLLDVVEHVRDPHHLFRQCNRVLRKDGLVYFHTPVVTPIDRTMHKLNRLSLLRPLSSVWQRGRTSVYHLQNYTRNSLDLLLTENGFQAIYIRIQNELSWPVSRYVRVFLTDQIGIPAWTAKLLTPVFWPILATNLVNPNKAIVVARKVHDQPGIKVGYISTK